jgi:hypothetical protein
MGKMRTTRDMSESTGAAVDATDHGQGTDIVDGMAIPAALILIRTTTTVPHPSADANGVLILENATPVGVDQMRSAHPATTESLDADL